MYIVFQPFPTETVNFFRILLIRYNMLIYFYLPVRPSSSTCRPSFNISSLYFSNSSKQLLFNFCLRHSVSYLIFGSAMSPRKPSEINHTMHRYIIMYFYSINGLNARNKLEFFKFAISYMHPCMRWRPFRLINQALTRAHTPSHLE